MLIMLYLPHTIDFMRLFLYEINCMTPERYPFSIIILRLAIDIFRVVTKDTQPPLLTPTSVIEYMNQHKDFFPLSVAQTLWLFHFSEDDVKNYELHEFIKKFYSQISQAII